MSVQSSAGKSARRRIIAALACIALATAVTAVTNVSSAHAADASCQSIGKTVRDPNAGSVFKDGFLCPSGAGHFFTPLSDPQPLEFGQILPGTNFFLCYSSSMSRAATNGHYPLLTGEHTAARPHQPINQARDTEVFQAEHGWGWVSDEVLGIAANVKPTRIPECFDAQTPESQAAARAAASAPVLATTTPSPTCTRHPGIFQPTLDGPGFNHAHTYDCDLVTGAAAMYGLSGGGDAFWLQWLRPADGRVSVVCSSDVNGHTFLLTKGTQLGTQAGVSGQATQYWNDNSHWGVIQATDVTQFAPEDKGSLVGTVKDVPDCSDESGSAGAVDTPTTNAGNA